MNLRDHNNIKLKPVFQYIILLGISIGIGIVLFQTMNEELPVIIAISLFCLLVAPFLIIWPLLSEKILLAILILSLPLTIDQTLFLRNHYGGAQGLVVSVNGISIVILWILYGWRKLMSNDTMSFQVFNPFGLIIMGLVTVCVLSIIRAVDKMFSLYELLEILKMILIFYYLANTISDKGNTRFILIFLIGGLFLESVIALTQLATGSSLNLRILGGRETVDLSALGTKRIFRMGGTLGNPNSLALYLIFIIMIPFALVFQKIKIYWKMILTSIFLLASITLLFTYSRAGWISFFVGIGIVVVFNLQKIPIVPRTYLILLVCLTIGISTILLWILPNPITDRLLADDRGSAYVRIPLMRVALTMMKENPLIGVGLNNYVEVDQLYDHTPEQVSHFFPLPVHNVYLQIGAETGLLGLLFFFLFLFYMFRQAIRIVPFQDDLSQGLLIGIVAGITGFTIIGLVENASMGSHHLYPMWLLSGLVAGLYHRKRFILSSE